LSKNQSPRLSRFFTSAKHIAHRGIHYAAPENSLLAFKRGASRGVPNELDVRRSKEGELIVFHDRSLHRLTGKRGSIDECTLKEIKSFPLLNSSEKIPTLRETLESVDGAFILHLKELDMEFSLKRLFKETQIDPERILIVSFSPWVVRECAVVLPQFSRALLVGRDKSLPIWSKFLPRWDKIQGCVKAATQFSRSRTVCLELDLVEGNIIKSLKEADLEVISWTARSYLDLEKARQHNLPAVTDIFPEFELSQNIFSSEVELVAA